VGESQGGRSRSARDGNRVDVPVVEDYAAKVTRPPGSVKSGTHRRQGRAVSRNRAAVCGLSMLAPSGKKLDCSVPGVAWPRTVGWLSGAPDEVHAVAAEKG